MDVMRILSGAVIAALYLAYVIDHESFGKYSQEYSYLGQLYCLL
jgi:hypothetical protein